MLNMMLDDSKACTSSITSHELTMIDIVTTRTIRIMIQYHNSDIGTGKVPAVVRAVSAF